MQFTSILESIKIQTSTTLSNTGGTRTTPTSPTASRRLDAVNSNRGGGQRRCTLNTIFFHSFCSQLKSVFNNKNNVRNHSYCDTKVQQAYEQYKRDSIEAAKLAPALFNEIYSHLDNLLKKFDGPKSLSHADIIVGVILLTR